MSKRGGLQHEPHPSPQPLERPPLPLHPTMAPVARADPTSPHLAPLHGHHSSGLREEPAQVSPSECPFSSPYTG